LGKTLIGLEHGQIMSILSLDHFAYKMGLQTSKPIRFLKQTMMSLSDMFLPIHINPKYQKEIGNNKLTYKFESP
jgi:hypothetical protein